ncbi:MAG: transposase [Hyphomicrobiales bacterium]|nr:transposase [Hyphomicrobiales bacterium]
MAEGIGRSRGDRTSKVHAAVDVNGRPFRLEISGGQIHDSQVMDVFLDWEVTPLAIVADKAYASTKIRQQIADEGALAVLLQNEEHEKAGNALREKSHKFLIYGTTLRNQVLDQLSPHPS